MNFTHLGVWLVISILLSFLFMISFTIIQINKSPGFGGCYSEYLDNEEIVFSGFDPFGNVYLVLLAFGEYPIINSTYPYQTTLPPLPETANSDLFAIAKFSPEMDLLWARLIGSDSISQIFIQNVKFQITTDGGLLVFGINEGEPFLPNPDYRYGSGANTFFILKLDRNGEREFLTTWMTDFSDFSDFFFDDTSTYLYYNGFLDPNEINSAVHWNGTVPSGNEHTIAKLSDEGRIQWVFYLPRDTEVRALKTNGSSLGFLLTDGDSQFGSTYSNNSWFFGLLDGARGLFTSLKEPPLLESSNTQHLILTSDGSNFLIFKLGIDHKFIYSINLTSNSLTPIQLFQTSFDFPSIFVRETAGTILLVFEFESSPVDAPAEGPYSEIELGDDSIEYYLFAVSSKGQILDGLHLYSSYSRTEPRYDYSNGNFLISLIQESAPFPIENAFQPEPLGKDDPFIAVLGNEIEKGTFYGNNGNLVMICYN